MIGELLTVMFFVIIMIFASCVSSYTGVGTNSSSIQYFIKQGDKVKIVTTNNEETSFVVVEVTDEAIVGERETVLFTDINKLKKQTHSKQNI
jgi:Asp/Glu/hydantoin racemase